VAPATRLLALVLPALLGVTGGACATTDEPPPLGHDAVVQTMTLVNGRFMATSPSREPSDAWNRAVYFEGVMALAAVSGDPRPARDATTWAESHAWGLHGGASTRFADDQCAGQTYLDLYALRSDETRIRDVVASVDAMVASDGAADWTWVDALQMSMPLFARVGVLRRDTRYFEKMHELYAYARDVVGGGLYSRADHLWWRDATFKPPYAEPNGKRCYWSRGNGWAYAALARVLDVLPESEAHRAEYVADFVAMSEALRLVVREDGFWNVSLHDPTHFGGKELTGTSLFTYGMAWGVARHVLPADIYRPIVERAWSAMVASAVHPDGKLGFVQGTGTQPSDRMPVRYDSTPNVEDFGVGCFLLAGSAVARLDDCDAAPNHTRRCD
jgi:rhamnogalacturonyl hydrolase YesR